MLKAKNFRDGCCRANFTKCRSLTIVDSDGHFRFLPIAKRNRIHSA